jgi:hypothetical protein
VVQVLFQRPPARTRRASCPQWTCTRRSWSDVPSRPLAIRFCFAIAFRVPVSHCSHWAMGQPAVIRTVGLTIVSELPDVARCSPTPDVAPRTRTIFPYGSASGCACTRTGGEVMTSAIRPCNCGGMRAGRCLEIHSRDFALDRRRAERQGRGGRQGGVADQQGAEGGASLRKLRSTS